MNRQGGRLAVSFTSDQHWDRTLTVRANRRSETAFVLTGDTATVLGTSFKWNALGLSLPKPTDDAKTHTVTLKATNGKWLITGYARTH